MNQVLSYWEIYIENPGLITNVRSLGNQIWLASVVQNIHAKWSWKCFFCDNREGKWMNNWMETTSEVNGKNSAIKHLIEKHGFIYSEKLLNMA